eukprot:636709-Rhodomonas_salina.1
MCGCVLGEGARGHVRLCVEICSLCSFACAACAVLCLMSVLARIMPYAASGTDAAGATQRVWELRRRSRSRPSVWYANSAIRLRVRYAMSGSCPSA